MNHARLLLVVLFAGTAAFGEEEHEEAHGHAEHESEDSGRSVIAPAMAQTMGIVVETAAPGTVRRTLDLHGVVVPEPTRVAELHARFPGVVREARKRIGDKVASGETVLVIEANDSLQRYPVASPIAGVVVSRAVNPGAIAGEGMLVTVVDLSVVWVELAAFQHDLDELAAGQRVSVRDVDGHFVGDGVVDTIVPIASPASQSMTARVVIPNDGGHLRPGLFVTGQVVLDEAAVGVAVRRGALQTLDGETVVFERVDDAFEARPIRTGRTDADWVEVVEGLTPGADYVAAGSYVVKADIEKSAAGHDH